MTLNRVQLLKAFMGHWELLAALGNAAEKLADGSTKTMVQRWTVLRDLGDTLAPELDQILASLQGTVAAQSLSLSMTEAEMEAEILTALRHYYTQSAGEQAAAKLVPAPGVSEKDHENKKAQVSFDAMAAASEQANTRFTGKWLNAALQLAQIVLPILLPKLIGA